MVANGAFDIVEKHCISVAIIGDQIGTQRRNCCRPIEAAHDTDHLVGGELIVRVEVDYERGVS